MTLRIAWLAFFVSVMISLIPEFIHFSKTDSWLIQGIEVFVHVLLVLLFGLIPALCLSLIPANRTSFAARFQMALPLTSAAVALFLTFARGSLVA